VGIGAAVCQSHVKEPGQRGRTGVHQVKERTQR
jgi:hypothetical protein